MKFSICIPNYNYAHYLPSTFESILKQTCNDYEIVVADNVSNDNSVEIIKQYEVKAPVRFKINATNLGFAGNLDSVIQLAAGDHVIMLSSDDVMKPDALERYKKLIDVLDRGKVMLTSAKDVIDAKGNLQVRYLS